MAKNNLTPILLIGAAAAAFFLLRRKTAAREFTQTDVELDVEATDSGDDTPIEVTSTTGSENFLSKLVPVVKSEAKKAIVKIKEKRKAKKAAKEFKQSLPKIKPKAAKTKLRKRKRSVKGFDTLPVLY